MTFLAPGRLWLLLGVLGLAVLYVVLQRKRRHYAVRFTNLDLLDSVAPRRPGWRRHVAAGGVALALTALVAGLARPARDERVPREEAVVMLAIDVSASMSATDVAPSRFEAAVDAAKDFVEEVPEAFQVGLVAFDSSARLMSTPTTDHDAVVAALDRLGIGAGTAAGEGIYASLDAIAATLPPADDTRAERPSATIILLADGATRAGRPVEDAAQAAADQGVPVTTIAFGTPTGVVELQGEVIPVPADPDTMRAIAQTTGGSFFEAATAAQLRGVYDDIQGRVGYTTEQREIVHLFLTAALVLLMAAVAASLLWTARFL